MTYQEARSKVIDAYFKDEIKPFDAKFCFCGTLCNNNPAWYKNCFIHTHNDFGFYKGMDYARMEKAIFDKLDIGDAYIETDHPFYEQALFEGMAAALDVLREIHLSRGENVDAVAEFGKRVLVK